MIKKIAFCTLFVFTFLKGFSQNDSIKKTNPIIYGEFSIGPASINAEGSKQSAIGLGLSLNYQAQGSLYTLRYNEIANFTHEVVVIFPIISKNSSVREFGLLYGRRWLFSGSSISLSGGVSINSYENRLNSTQTFEKSNHFGVPLEVNIRFFKKRKKRFRVLYGLVPIGEPTAFGRSFGLKFSGNFSKRGFFLFGLTFGLGAHKYY